MDQFPAHVEIPVLWGDMDAFRHVNNTRFFRYMETARISYLERVNLSLAEELNAVGPILAQASCKFVAPLAYPDSVRVGCRTSAIRGAEELEQEYLLESAATWTTVAVGWARIAAYDYVALRKASFPEELLAAVRELEGGQL
jgi:acyl-CoA thioester hydrolase